MTFSITATDPHSHARTGRLITDHGVVETPAFLPIGTAGAVKAVHFHELTNTVGAAMMLANTYHLFLRPGIDVIGQAGGLHRFIGWSRPLLTDSGGYQIFSLADRRTVTDEGVYFHSHIDGARHLFTPESVIDIQRIIGADIIMAFDECIGYPSSLPQARAAIERTHQWLDRCLAQFRKSSPRYGHEQVLFPIVQGGTYRDLRLQSAEYISAKNCIGNAIGGLSVGEPAELLYEHTELVCSILPRQTLRYLMGVGMPDNVLHCIGMGVDMFDCVIPTRNGRNGMLFTTKGIINIRNRKWQYDFSPLDELDNPISQNHSKSFLRHLLLSNEILGLQIASLQNLCFYEWMFQQARAHIAQGDFTQWKSQAVRCFMTRL